MIWYPLPYHKLLKQYIYGHFSTNFYSLISDKKESKKIRNKCGYEIVISQISFRW